jgi:hypothetical protein
MTSPGSPWRPPPRRLGLILPFALLGLAVLALAGAWIWARGEVAQGLEAARAATPGAPLTLAYETRRVGGFPFRLDVDLTGVRLAEPSGWGLEAPRLKAEAYVFAPGHWVVYAPDGLTLTRRRDGPLVVTGKVLRASLSDLAGRPPRLSVEGRDLAFATPPGARPFLLTSAKEVHVHTRAGPNDQGAAYLEVDQAQARLSGLVARIAQGGPVSLLADGVYSHADALAGDDWPHAARNWARAGGDFDLRRLKLVAGEAVIQARPGHLAVGEDGRLEGELTLGVRQAARVVGEMGAQGKLTPDAARSALAVIAVRGAPVASLNLDFQAGRATLGPVALGAAPRVF